MVATPAVSHGVIYVGDYDGTLYALNEHTGALLWSGNAGNQFFDPDNITVSGSVVFTVTVSPAGAGPAQLSAWNALGCGSVTCGPLWTSVLTSPEAPGVAVSRGTVFVVEGNGGVYAYGALGCGTVSCMPKWEGQYAPTADNDAYASIAIANGTVYVGNGTVSAVSAFRVSGCGDSICLPIRQYQVSGTNEVGLAVAYGRLYVGTGSALYAFQTPCATQVCPLLWQDTAAPGAKLLVANGVVYAESTSSVLADNASTGARLWQSPIVSEPAGGPAVANGTFYVGNTGSQTVVAYHL